MATLLGIVAGLLAFTSARIVPHGRRGGWLAELLAAVLAALACGAIATALGFGGWRDPDWRALLFAFLGALAAAGIVRAVRMTRD